MSIRNHSYFPGLSLHHCRVWNTQIIFFSIFYFFYSFPTIFFELCLAIFIFSVNLRTIMQHDASFMNFWLKVALFCYLLIYILDLNKLHKTINLFHLIADWFVSSIPPWYSCIRFFVYSTNLGFVFFAQLMIFTFLVGSCW